MVLNLVHIEKNLYYQTNIAKQLGITLDKRIFASTEATESFKFHNQFHIVCMISRNYNSLLI